MWEKKNMLFELENAQEWAENNFERLRRVNFERHSESTNHVNLEGT